ncbi:MAG: nitroreductase/quinone reductase family protein [Ornithinimicrobium sp.]|uniref:nitroreductase/quinone reductase family protein n=1 Tax=Ornithinimicrobium sp. TaxID=1977084 RepID=UPI0026DED3BF|nr:nitroreductase/quinone reductase family protein [Ornithinimicrobium sp.]MDO5741003.1 nitroreductase/quinone reductase family protein [Ornithinimicrobium sp.]
MSIEPHAPATSYLPEKTSWVATQLAQIDAAGDTRVADINGMSIIVMTMRGARSGLLRRVPVMRVEHDGTYAAFASKGGAAKHPTWFYNLNAGGEVLVQDGTEQLTRTIRLLEAGPERDQWWDRGVAAFPPYAEYQQKTDRQIPVFLLEPRNG